MNYAPKGYYCSGYSHFGTLVPPWWILSFGFVKLGFDLLIGDLKWFAIGGLVLLVIATEIPDEIVDVRNCR